MKPVSFRATYVMEKSLADPIASIRTLPERDAYIGSLVPNNPDLAAGKYRWFSLSEGRMLLLTGDDIHRHFRYGWDRPIRGKDYEGREDEYFDALKRQNEEFVRYQKKSGRPVFMLPEPPGLLDSVKRLLQALQGRH